MKYFAIDIETDTTGKISPAIYTYDDVTTCVATYHKKIGSAMTNENCTKILCMAIDEKGGSYGHTYWARPVVEVEVTEGDE